MLKKKFLVKKCKKILQVSKFSLPLHRKTKRKSADYVAQLVEHIPFKDGVLGSSPSVVTKFYFCLKILDGFYFLFFGRTT